MTFIEEYWKLALAGFVLGVVLMLGLTGCAEKRSMDWGSVAKAYEDAQQHVRKP